MTMCVINFKVARSHYSSPGQFSHIWMDVKKIESLHISNHKDKMCHKLYNLEPFKKEIHYVLRTNIRLALPV